MLSIGKNSTIIEGGFYIKDTKNGDDRIVPIHPKMVRICQFFPIPWSRIWMQRLVKNAMKDAGYKHLHFHDLRHGAASEMINAGVDLYTVGAVLGHKDNNSTKRYSHLSTKTLAEAIRKIG
jgi:integrase